MITSTCHDRENGPFQQAMKECYDLCMAKKGNNDAYPVSNPLTDQF